MADRKPKPKTKFQEGDEVILRGEVTRVAMNGDEEEITVALNGYWASRITLRAKHAEKAEDSPEGL